MSRLTAAAAVREFFERCPARIIGVTGTRGLAETAGLLTSMFEEAGRRVHRLSAGEAIAALGRIKPSDLVVLELPAGDIVGIGMSLPMAVCVAVAPEEDRSWTGSSSAYMTALGDLFWQQQPGDMVIYQADNELAVQIANLSPGRKLPFLAEPGAHIENGSIVMAGIVVCRLEDVSLRAAADVAVACAAVTAAWEFIGHKPAAMQRAMAAWGTGHD